MCDVDDDELAVAKVSVCVCACMGEKMLLYPLSRARERRNCYNVPFPEGFFSFLLRYRLMLRLIGTFLLLFRLAV